MVGINLYCSMYKLKYVKKEHKDKINWLNY